MPLTQFCTSACALLPLLPPAPVAGIFLAAGPAVGVLRALRALRILRTIRFALGLKRIATTLYITLPTLANATLVFSLFLFMFSVLGNQLFYGAPPPWMQWLQVKE